MGGAMKFLVISDLHAAEGAVEKLESQFAEADGVLFAGDFAECFKPDTGLAALERLCRAHGTIFAVLGNCDSPDFIGELEEHDISVEKSLVFHEGLAFAGSGGGSFFTGKTEFERTEEELLSDFDIVRNSVAESGDASLYRSLILISHNPPKDTKCDAVNAELHAGSGKFAEFIRETQPLAVVTGHIHEGRGIDRIGDTVIVNPGALAEGHYAWLDVSRDSGGGWKAAAALGA